MRHPAHRYIVYLISRQTRTAAEIVSHLDSIDVPLPIHPKGLQTFEKRIKELMGQIKIPHGFNPTDAKPNDATVEFLSRHGISGIWQRDPFVSTALDILLEPVIRRSLEAYLLSPLQPGHVAIRLQDRYGLSPDVMNPRVVRTYAHYFWDPEALDHSGWRKFVDEYMGGYDKNEDILSCLMSPRNAAGAAMSLAVVDRSVDALTPVVMYTTMRDMAFRGFLESALMMKPGLSKAHACFMHFQAVKGAEDEVAKHRGSTAAFKEEMERIDASYDTSKSLSYKDIPKLGSTTETVIDTVGESETHA